MKSSISLALAVVCLAAPVAGETLSDADRVRVEREVRRAVADYVEAVKANDLPKILSFWGDFDDFVHAGDGRIFGDHQKWTAWITHNLADKWLYWRNTDIHVAVLAPNAAAYTMNFENSFVKDGETREVTGSWTYVFRKTEAGWQVVHSNGHHIGLSYDE
jgi:ketosteroid isomerase-like protein